MNYSKYVKSINGATKPDIGCRDLSIVNAQASNYDCPIDVDVNAPVLFNVETHEHQGSEDRPSLSSVILVSKVASLKSLHDVNTDLPTELDPPLRTSIHVLVQNSAPQAPESSLAGNDRQASFQRKIVSKKVLTSDPTNTGLVSKPERTQRSCSTATNVSGQVWYDHARIHVDGEHLIGR
jgi:hypothetical protein